jgi:hypothetical protein
VLAVHAHDALDVVRGIVEEAGGQLAYQSRETSPIVLTKRYHPANTNPLVFKHTALFRFEDRKSCGAATTTGVLNGLHEAAGELSVQLYRRVRRRDAVPAPLAALLR